MSAEKIVIENVNIPGKTYLANKAKYEAMLGALKAILPSESPGSTQNEMFDQTAFLLPDELFPGGRTVAYWVKTVQLDQEAKGNLIREQTKPLRWHWREVT